jgi:hypothetical protein
VSASVTACVRARYRASFAAATAADGSRKACQLLRGASIVRRQPAGQLAMVPAWPRQRHIDARPQSRAGQQSLVVRGVQYRIAGIGRLALPTGRKIPIEIQRVAARQSCLQRIARERITEAGAIEGEEIVPVLRGVPVPAENRDADRRRESIPDTLEVALDRGAVDLLDVVFERCGFR